MSNQPPIPPLPQDFIAAINAAYPQEAERLLGSLEHSQAVLSVRGNAAKLTRYGSSLAHLPITTSVPWCPNGYYLAERPFFAHDPLWHAGAYYVQEAGSMAVAQIAPFLGDKPMDILDLSAAPGGKSTLLTQIMPPGSRLVVNEPIPKRTQVLNENLQKWGTPEVIVTQAYPEQLRQSGVTFDGIIADVPCSGEGLFRKSPEARNEWSLKAVEECALRQRSILREAWAMLRPNGWLLYATCTFNRQENEENVRFLMQELGADHVSLPSIPTEWGWVEGKEGLGYHFLPGLTKSEGFFFAFLRKGEDEDFSRSKRATKQEKKSERRGQVAIPNKQYLDWVKEEYRSYASLAIGEEVVLLSEELLSIYKQLQEARVHMLSVGISCATMKGNKLRPSSLLPFSQAIESDAFAQVSLSLSDALLYLSGEAVALPSSVPLGYCLIFFEGMPIGLAHNLGNRANNLYPKAYRLKTLPRS